MAAVFHAVCESCGFQGRTYREYGAFYRVGDVKCRRCASLAGHAFDVQEGRPEWMVAAIAAGGARDSFYGYSSTPDVLFAQWKQLVDNI